MTREKKVTSTLRVMINWFRKKETSNTEICIPKIFIDNKLEFEYQHILEIASIPLSNLAAEVQIINAVESNDIDFLKEHSKSVENINLVKIFSLIGKKENEKMLLAVYKPIKSDEEVKLIAYNWILNKELKLVNV